MRISFYYFYVFVLLILNFLIFLTPILARSGSELAPGLYAGFHNICHQLTARSLCMYNNGISDCTLQAKVFSESTYEVVQNNQGTGYKFPVDARDMAIYLMMLIGGLVLSFVSDKNGKNIPNILILILAAAPVGIDGFTQLFGWRESTNQIRLITGVILGLAIPFFLIPTANVLINKFGRRKITKEEK